MVEEGKYERFWWGSKYRREKGNKNFGQQCSFGYFVLFIFVTSYGYYLVVPQLLLFVDFFFFYRFLFLSFPSFTSLFSFNMYFLSSFVLGCCVDLFILKLFFNKVFIHKPFLSKKCVFFLI